MSLLGTPVGDTTLVGYILHEEKHAGAEVGDGDSEDSEVDEEEQEPEFLDMSELQSVSSGGHVFRSTVPPKNEVEFEDIIFGRKRRVEGRFALKEPWWEVTCTARHRGNRLVVKGYPSYQLRSDLDGEDWRPIVSLFLAACDVQPEHSQRFFEWLPKERDVNLSNLTEVLNEFEEEGNKGEAQSIKGRVFCSAAGMQLRAAPRCPLVLKYLPTLLPSRFADLLGKGKKKTRKQAGPEDTEEEMEEVDLNLLENLENIMKTDVWKLGFSYVLYMELKLVRCEAQLTAFVDCDLFDRIEPLQQNALRAYDRLKDHCHHTGSTFMDHQALCDTLGSDHGMPDEAAWAAIQFLKGLGVVVRDGQRVALQNLHTYETGIARRLRCLAKGEPWKIPLDAGEVLYAAAVERRLSKMQRADGSCGTATSDPDSKDLLRDLPPIELDKDQVLAAQMICDNPVTVISGKGGCGKTTVVSQIFKAAVRLHHSDQEEVENACADFENDSGGSQLWMDAPISPSFVSEGNVTENGDGKRSLQSDEILLTAPTGKAASLLTKNTGFTAYTLHQILWSFMNAKKNRDGEPELWKFEPVRVLVVDEGSLVCVQLLHTVLSMLVTYAQLRKFVLLGDVRQLPSIQPGNILHDLFHTLKMARWAIEMRTNHRAESELIVKNAGLIADMGGKRRCSPLDFDAIIDLNRSHTMPASDKKFILVRLPSDESYQDLQNAIELLIDSGPGLKDDYTSQFIAFKRSDVALINELCCRHYNKHPTKNHKNRQNFVVGDKVCCTKNGYITDEDKMEEYRKQRQQREGLTDADDATGDGDKKDKENVRLRLCNGEIFFIREDKTVTEDGRRQRNKRFLTLDDRDGRMVKVGFKELQRECRPKHAWARTIHTFQGSENETIVYVVGVSSAQTWKHVYTAVTRGQKRVYVIAKRGVIESAIQKQGPARNTQLGGLMKELLAELKLSTKGGETPGHPESSQATASTPRRTAAGCRPMQSTPVSSQTPSASRQDHSRPLLPKCLWEADKVKVDKAVDTSMTDDIIFSQSYSWPPMNSSEEDSSGRLGQCGGLGVDANCYGSEGQPSGAGASLGDCALSNKRMHPSEMSTPHKQPKKEQTDSPLGCSSLELLSLRTPESKKALFRDPPSE